MTQGKPRDGESPGQGHISARGLTESAIHETIEGRFGRSSSRMHAHWTSDARDCDGPISHYWDVAPDERDAFEDSDAADTDEWKFELRMAEALVKVPYGGDGMVTITFDRSEDGRLRGTMSHDTEEGYSAQAFEICKSDDFDPVPTQRDVYAERMGY